MNSPSQEEIFSSFRTNEDGIVLNPANLEAFLEKFGMTSYYAHHRISFPEIDFIIEKELKQKKDILAAYYFNESNRHSSLVINLNKKITLQDSNQTIKELDFLDLLNKMPLDFQCGFYFINVLT